MHTQIACMLCSIDPGTANMLMPIAQATLISAPILLRDQIRQGVRVVRERRRDCIAPDADEGATEEGTAADESTIGPTDR